MVAIILVNYNGSTDTIDCIKSLNKIKNLKFEIIVVDNCSTDDSIEKLQKIKNNYKFTLIEAESNNGFSAGNNIGIEYAKKIEADYYLLLNNDTVVESDFLEKLLSPFENKNCGATISKILYFSNKNMIWYNGGNLNNKTGRTEHYDFNKMNIPDQKENQKVTFASGCCLCISKEVVDKVGLLDENFFLYEEDAEYSYRILKNGFDIIYVPESIIYHKVSASTGQNSAMSQYYSVRNKYFFIKICFKGYRKFIAYAYCTVQFIFRCLKREMNLKYYIMGLKAFLRKETGKMKGTLK